MHVDAFFVQVIKELLGHFLSWQNNFSNRKSTSLLTILSIAKVCLLVGIERERQAAKLSFESTVSWVDLIAGALWSCEFDALLRFSNWQCDK